MKDFTILSKIGKVLYWWLNLLSLLGSGAFSEVYKVFRKSDQAEYALKKVSVFSAQVSLKLFRY